MLLLVIDADLDEARDLGCRADAAASSLANASSTCAR